LKEKESEREREQYSEREKINSGPLMAHLYARMKQKEGE
jgi:hypothetical protein